MSTKGVAVLTMKVAITVTTKTATALGGVETAVLRQLTEAVTVNRTTSMKTS